MATTHHAERFSPEGWRATRGDAHFRREFLISLAALAILLLLFRRFADFAERRPGIVLPDPLLALFTPVDVTWVTFGVIYLSLAGAIYILARNPRSLLAAIQTYAMMVIFRFGAMYLLPLEPPAGMLPLKDPFVELFGSGATLTKDLFFSGHTATLVLLALTAPGRGAKAIFATAACVVAFCVLLQHVHYSIDVFVAPFAAYTAFRLVTIRMHRSEPRFGEFKKH